MKDTFVEYSNLGWWLIFSGLEIFHAFLAFRVSLEKSVILVSMSLYI
jgi:hypothetical protein